MKESCTRSARRILFFADNLTQAFCPSTTYWVGRCESKVFLVHGILRDRCDRGRSGLRYCPMLCGGFPQLGVPSWGSF